MLRKAAFVIGLVNAGLAAPATAADVNLRVINAFDPQFPSTNLILKNFTDAVEKSSRGRISFRVSGPEVAKPFEQLEPTSQGVFDILFTSPPYHAGTTTTAMGIYALAPDPKAFRTNGLFDIVDNDYQQHNLKLLAVIYGEKAETGGFQIILKRPLGPSGDLQGLKIRSSQTHQPFVQGMGGQPTQMAGGEIYSALDKGIIDGAAWPLIGVLEYRWNEVAKYMARPTFGYTAYTITMNLGRFKRLDPADQAILVEEGRLAEIAGIERMDAFTIEETKKLKATGMQEVQFNRKRFDETMVKYFDEVWNAAEQFAPSRANVQRFRERARALGLAR
jgi:TRAP-type C4-dicarboxylate transport system substrate-binding protein